MSHAPGHRSYDEPPPVGEVEEEDTPGPLGVPRDYRATVMLDHRSMGSADSAARWSGPREVAPRYFSGHHWTVPRQLASEDRAALQLSMKQIGLIGPRTSVVLGAWDQASANAFKEVLSWANANGTTWVEALRDMQANAGTYGVTGQQELEPDTYTVSNPDDVRSVLRETIKNRLGSGGAISDERYAELVAEYQRMEQAYQRRRGEGGTVEEPPSMETFADLAAKKADPVAYTATKVVGALRRVMAMMGGEV